MAVSFGLICSCSSAADQRVANTQNAANPETVCTMPDGRVLLRMTVDRGGMNADHYVYWFKNKDGKPDLETVSVNYAVPAGKSSRIQTIILDGMVYTIVTNNIP
jgi:hypothetical protein